MKLEGLWILTNLAYGSKEQITVMLECKEMNVLAILDAVFRELKDLMAVEQCLWFVGNITGTSIEFRDKVL